MKKTELTKVIEVLEREGISPDLVWMLKAIKSNPESDTVDLINRPDCAAVTIWTREDFLAEMEEAECEFGEEIVNEVMARCKPELEDCSDGWFTIQENMEEVLAERQWKESVEQHADY